MAVPSGAVTLTSPFQLPKPRLGISISEETNLFPEYPHETVLVVQSVVPGGPCDRAGVQPNDTLLALNGHPLHTKSDLARLYADAPADRPVVLQCRAYNTKEQRQQTCVLPASAVCPTEALDLLSALLRERDTLIQVLQTRELVWANWSSLMRARAPISDKPVTLQSSSVKHGNGENAVIAALIPHEEPQPPPTPRRGPLEGLTALGSLLPGDATIVSFGKKRPSYSEAVLRPEPLELPLFGERPRLGVSVFDDLSVDRVVPGSICALAGVQKGDRLVGWNDLSLNSKADLHRCWAQARVGELVTLLGRRPVQLTDGEALLDIAFHLYIVPPQFITTGVPSSNSGAPAELALEQAFAEHSSASSTLPVALPHPAAAAGAPERSPSRIPVVLNGS